MFFATVKWKIEGFKKNLRFNTKERARNFLMSKRMKLFVIERRSGYYDSEKYENPKTKKIYTIKTAYE